MPHSNAVPAPLSLRRIARAWWPLAASWMLMSAELPVVSLAVARLANPEINLAAYGGLVFPIALIIESPIIMLLSASTALSKDWASYLKGRRFMMWAGALLTLLHLTIALTPLYDLIATRVISAPPEIIEPARLGLLLMVPWTWSIAYRRFNQGVLIRFDQSRVIGLGTAVRFAALCGTLLIGTLIGTLPGIAVGAGAVILGVLAEAIFIGWRVRPLLNGRLKEAPRVEPALTYRVFLAFYIPLVMTAFLTLGAQPVVSAALSRMPRALESLAIWTVLTGVLFLFQSMGLAFNEVVVALLDEPGSWQALRRFTTLLVSANTAFVLLLVTTPLAYLWFGRGLALAPPLAELAQRALWLALPLPGLAVLQAWYQGALLHSGRTRGITEAVVLYMITNISILVAGVVLARWDGIYVGLTAATAGLLVQTIWLWWRSRPARKAVAVRDSLAPVPHPAGAAAD